MVLYISEVDALKEFVDGLKKSAGCAHGLAHYQSNPSWLKIRDLLEGVIEQGQKLAVAKSMPRQEVLEALNQRMIDAPKDLNGN